MISVFELLIDIDKDISTTTTMQCFAWRLRYHKTMLPLTFSRQCILFSSVSDDLASRNFYELLEIDYNASTAEVKAAYFKLSKQYHPDRNSDPKAIEYFSAITTAYEVLKNPKKRVMYDSRTLQFGSDGKPIGEAILKTPSERTPESYGRHARHPEYLFKGKNVLKGKQSNYMSYERLRKRTYDDLIYQRTVSSHRVHDHKMKLAKQDAKADQRKRLYGVGTMAAVGCMLLAYYVYLRSCFKEALRRNGKKCDKIKFADVVGYGISGEIR